MKGIAVAIFVFVFLTGTGGAAASDKMDNYWTDEQLVEWEEFVMEHHQQKQTPEERERYLEPRSEVIPNLDPLLYFNESRAFLLVNARNDYNVDFFEYQLGWEVQITQSYCSIAAATAAFNSLKSTVIDQDGTPFAVGVDPAYVQTGNPGNYQFATQADVGRDLLMGDCSHCACQALGGKENAKSISRIGLGIGNVPALANCYLKQNGYLATAYRNDDDGMLKETIINAVTDPMKRVIVNYRRSNIGQLGGGHWTPIASYNKEMDMLLLLDVAKYKYPPVWVTWDTLVAGSVATNDTEATLGQLPNDIGIDWKDTDNNGTEYKQIITLIKPYTTTGPRGFVVMAPTNPVASKSKSKRSKSKSTKSKSTKK
mmetsp:Transcript_34151/g.38897  ORF Transcript_34151/g.38897 Transcript_34151/m.38897 type:complete len:370 (-) Transcript_34151:133-1242(-)